MTYDENGYYLTVGLSGVVLRDIIGMMKRVSPDLLPIKVASLQEGADHIAEAQTVPIAFLNLPPDSFIASELSGVLAMLRTKVVLMGDAAEDAENDIPFAVLARPFAEDDIIGVLTPCSQTRKEG